DRGTSSRRGRASQALGHPRRIPSTPKVVGGARQRDDGADPERCPRAVLDERPHVVCALECLLAALLATTGRTLRQSSYLLLQRGRDRRRRLAAETDHPVLFHLGVNRV